MKARSLLIFLLSICAVFISAQNVNTDKLDELFNSLQQRDEAMGSITIAKNGKVLYNRSIGFRLMDDSLKIAANSETNYRIWSITKLYTATMIMQLVEEGKMSLETPLDAYFPEIPNAAIITIGQMLNHTSGIFDFINDSEKEWDNSANASMAHKLMIQLIAQSSPTAQPGVSFRYSNSNYLLLGYIIERLDGNLYEASLDKRIASQIGLTSTYFGDGALDGVENKAYTYTYTGQWIANYDEGDFSGLIPAGAGGIVSTTRDMALFIDALFSGKLISQTSLDKMIAGPASYHLGLMKTDFRGRLGYGHTGGYVAESSLFYYPTDSLTIAYCTNGILIRKEEIIDHVLKIYYNLPFGVSWNRNYLALIIGVIGILFFIGVRKYYKISIAQGLTLGYIIPGIFCLGLFISGKLNGEYSPIRDGLTELDTFYCYTGTFMSGIQLCVALLFVVFSYYLWRSCKFLQIRVWPILPIVFIILALVGATLFPLPNEAYALFVNIIIITVLGPLLTLIFWRKQFSKSLNILAAISLILIISSLAVIISRPSIPEFVMNYFGLLQRTMYLGIGIWIVALSYSLIKKVNLINFQSADNNLVAKINE